MSDEGGSFLDPLVRRTGAPKGRTPVPTCFGRDREKVSTSAAITVAPHRRRVGLHWKTDPAHCIDAAGVVTFSRGPLRHGDRDLGRVSHHEGPSVREPLAKFPRLHLARLPAYAPDLNLAEMIWCCMKYGLMANCVPRDVRELDGLVRAHPGELKGTSRVAPVALDRLGATLPRQEPSPLKSNHHH